MFQQVSHNLKTPLNAIRLINSANSLETNLEKIYNNIKVIEINETLLYQMISDILDYNSLDQCNF